MSCSPCRHSIEGACRRFPPVLVEPAGSSNDRSDMTWPATWAFPPATARCGEFAAVLQMPCSGTRECQRRGSCAAVVSATAASCGPCGWSEFVVTKP